MAPLQAGEKVILLTSQETAGYISLGMKSIKGHQRYSVAPEDIIQGDQKGVGAVFFETVELASNFYQALVNRTGLTQFSRPPLNDK